LLTLEDVAEAVVPEGLEGLISKWVVDDLTVGTSNSELWANRVSGKPSLQRGDGVGKTRVVEVSATFNNHKVVNNRHASGNYLGEWTDTDPTGGVAGSYTVFLVCDIDGHQAVNDCSFMECRDSVAAEFSFIWRAYRASEANHWSWLYTNSQPAWSGDTPITDGEFDGPHVYTLTLDHDEDKSRAYVDGVLKFTDQPMWTNYDLGDQIGVFGSYSNIATSGLYGQFAEARLYNRVLTAPEIASEVATLKTLYGIT
jgi:hypothetical protein